MIISVLMVLSLLPSTVFAASACALDGKLKISGIPAVGNTLSADFKEVKPADLSEDSVSYVWSRMEDKDDKEPEGTEPGEDLYRKGRGSGDDNSPYSYRP